jgi:hypothetical protein
MAEERIRTATRRRTVWILGPILLVIGVGALIPAGIRAAAHSGLAAVGFADSRGGVISLGLHGVRIADIEIGEKGRMTVAVTLSPARLIHGRLDTITISNTVLHGVVALSGQLDIDGFAMPPAQKSPAKTISLPARRVDITGVALELGTPLGKSTVTGNGMITGTDNGLRLTGTIGLAGTGATGGAPVVFSLTAAGWSAILSPVRIAFPGKSDDVNVVDGHLALAGTDAGITGDAELSGENLRIGAIPVRKLSLNLKAGADGLVGGFQLVPKTGGAGIDASLKTDAAGMTATLRAGFDEIGGFSKLLGGTVSGPLQANLTVHNGPAGAKRPVTFDLAYDGIVPGGVLLRGARLKATGAFDPVENALTLTSCGAFSADGVTLGEIGLAKLSGCLGPTADGALFDQDPLGKIALAGVLNNLTAMIPSSSGALAEATIRSLRMAVETTDGQLTGFTVGLDGGAINLPSLGTGLHDLSAKAGGDAGGALSGTIGGNLGPSSPNALSLPIAGTLGGNIGGPTLTMTAGSLFKASLTGKTARLDMPATQLGEGSADLLKLVPGLATSVSKLSGTLALTLAADWSGAAPTSHGTIVLKDIGATTPNFTLEGLDTTIALTGLGPLSTADGQIVTMKRLLVGVPLTDGRITVGLDRHHKLNITDAHWSLAGGTVGTYDQQLDLYGPDQNLAVVVKGVALAELLTLANVNGLSAEGTVEGAIPLRRAKDIIRIEHGVLQTSTAGVLRYDPADTPSFLRGQPGEGTAILRDALKDFRYQQLSLTIDGDLGGEEQIKLKLNGANPTLYGGLPVALNVNLSGALDSIARSSVEAYTNPAKTVRRKLDKKQGEKQ